MEIYLQPQQMITAATIGVRRTVYAIANGLNATYGGLKPGDPGAFDNHILGAMSEYAVAKALNLFWNENVGSIHGVDVGGCVEVRTIRKPGLRLIIHEKDQNNVPFVLVLAQPPLFSLIGWIWGRDGKKADFWCDPTNNNRPSYFVPPPYLPIDTLIKKVKLI